MQSLRHHSLVAWQRAVLPPPALQPSRLSRPSCRSRPLITPPAARASDRSRRRAARRGAGEDGDDREHGGDQREGRRVGRFDVEQQRAGEPREQQRAADAARQADAHGREPLPDDHSRHRRRRRAERHPHADLARPLTHRKRHDAGDACGGDEQRDDREQRDEHRGRSRRGERARARRLERLDLAERLARIDPPHGGLNAAPARPADPRRCARAAWRPAVRPA